MSTRDPSGERAGGGCGGEETPQRSPVYDRRYYTEVTRTERSQRFGAHWWSSRYLARRVQRALDRVGGRRCLELGCAHGVILARLERRAETYGIDLSRYAVEASRTVAPRSRVVVGDVERDLPALFASAFFDVVFAKSLLEHLDAPGSVLARCRELLRPGGALLYSVPSTVNRLRRLKGDDWIGTRDPTHRSLLAPEEWARLTVEAGLEVTRTYSNGFWDVPYLPLIPAGFQLLLFGLPTALTLLTGGAFLPPSLGENLFVEAVRPR